MRIAQEQGLIELHVHINAVSMPATIILSDDEGLGGAISPILLAESISLFQKSKVQEKNSEQLELNYRNSPSLELVFHAYINKRKAQ